MTACISTTASPSRSWATIISASEGAPSTAGQCSGSHRRERTTHLVQWTNTSCTRTTSASSGTLPPTAISSLSAASRTMAAVPPTRSVSALPGTRKISPTRGFRSTLMHYLTRWRLQLAAHLLERPGVAVARVAQEVGYGSEPAFNRALKRLTGSPPAAWRRSRAA